MSWPQGRDLDLTDLAKHSIELESFALEIIAEFIVMGRFQFFLSMFVFFFLFRSILLFSFFLLQIVFSILSFVSLILELTFEYY